MNPSFIFLNIAFFFLLISIPPSSSAADPKNETTKNPDPTTTTSNIPPVTTPATNPAKTQFKNTKSFSGSVNISVKFSKVYAFGDSYTDTGNAQLMGGLKSFIGALLTNLAKKSDFKPNGQRLCNGRLLIDFLCEQLQLPHLKPYKSLPEGGDEKSGVNFAIAGSSSLQDNFFMSHKLGQSLWWKPMPESVRTQIRWFNKLLLKCILGGKLICRAEMGKALFFVGAVGLSDYVRIFGSVAATHFPVSSQFLAEKSAESICQLLKVMLDNGAKHIVIQGLPPIGCLPLDLVKSSTDRDGIGCNSRANQLIKAHNQLLEKRIEEHRKLYSSSKIIFADFWKAYETILTNYKQYNFEEPFKVCCGVGDQKLNFNIQKLCGVAGTSTCKDPSKYIVWDGVHVTEAMNKQMANLLFTQKGYCRPSFTELTSAT